MILERPRFCLPPRYKDRSMDPEKHDMVIAAVADLDETLAFLQRMRRPSSACRHSSLTSTSATSSRRSKWLGPFDAMS